MTFTQEWVDVNERLPEKAGTYLVNIHETYNVEGLEHESSLVLKAWYNPVSSLILPKDIGWALMDEFYPCTDSMREYITHWTTWPQPIKEYE